MVVDESILAVRRTGIAARVIGGALVLVGTALAGVVHARLEVDCVFVDFLPSLAAAAMLNGTVLLLLGAAGAAHFRNLAWPYWALLGLATLLSLYLGPAVLLPRLASLAGCEV